MCAGADWEKMVDNFYTSRNLGLSPGASYVLAIGNNPDVDSGASLPEDIWYGGGVYPWMTGATSLEVVSSSANDTAAGTGMRTILIEGLDTDYLEVSFLVTMNGLTPVVFPQSIYRLHRAVIATAGSLGSNAGTITIRNAGGGTTRATFPPGYGTTRSSSYTVPAGKVLLLTSLTVSINRPTAARDATVSLMIRNPTGAFFLSNEVAVDGNPFYRELFPAAPIPATYDIIMRCPYVSADNTDITAGWTGVLKTV